MDKRVIWIVVITSLIFLGIGVFIGSRNSNQDGAADAKVETNLELLKVSSDDWVKGNKNAEVTLVEYGDFQCPSCKAYYPLLKQLLVDEPKKVNVVFRQYPLTQLHSNAYLAAKGAEAAGKQEKFWEMHDLLFEKQESWQDAKNFEELLIGYAKELGLNEATFKSDLNNTDVDTKIQKDRISGDTLGVNSTPTFFVNGQKISKLPGSLEALKMIINSESEKITPDPNQEVHKHFDIEIAVNGSKVNLTQDKYQEKDESIHLHDNFGEVAHIHKNGVTLRKFIDSLKVSDMAVVLVKVNGKEISTWESYEPEDLDRILVSFGTATANQISKLEESLTDKACIYSESCPERGKPPTEKCVGGLGTDCK